MKILIYKFILAFISTCGVSQAQEFEVPQQVKLETTEDYKKYQPAVLAGITWLENTPVTEQLAKREQASAFLMQYMSGAPDFSIAIFPFQMEHTKKNPELLMSFLGGWTRFALENPTEKENAVLANKAGFKSLLKVYALNKDKGIKKDKKVEKLMKMDDAALEKWITKDLG